MIKEITPNMYGKRFSCTIEGCFVEEAVADVNKHGEVFILQNVKSGWYSGDLLDKYNGKYTFTWNVMR